MKEELHNKIAADIEKSGFGSEMKALRVIQEAGFQASSSVHYLDKDAGISRESDIAAHVVSAEASENEREIHYQSFSGLSVEVKKSERPWVVFKSVGRGWEGSAPLAFCAGVHPKFRRGINHTIGSTGLSKEVGWTGNGLHESFKSPDQPSRWYSAFVSACKAAEHELQENSWERDEDARDGHFPYLWLSVPVVVLDGVLVSADLGQEGELLLSEEAMCSVRFVYNTPNYPRKQYFVDLVTLGGLPTYLQFVKDRNVQLKEGLLKIAAFQPPVGEGRIKLGGDLKRP